MPIIPVKRRGDEDPLSRTADVATMRSVHRPLLQPNQRVRALAVIRAAVVPAASAAEPEPAAGIRCCQAEERPEARRGCVDSVATGSLGQRFQRTG
jgi:hypothetical protein